MATKSSSGLRTVQRRRESIGCRSANQGQSKSPNGPAAFKTTLQPGITLWYPYAQCHQIFESERKNLPCLLPDRFPHATLFKREPGEVLDVAQFLAIASTGLSMCSILMGLIGAMDEQLVELQLLLFDVM